MKNIVIIGGGIAGLEASHVLSKLGHRIWIVEKEKETGGHVAQWDRLFPSQQAASEIVEPLKKTSENVKIFTSTTVENIQKNKNNTFQVAFSDKSSVEADAILLASGFNLFDARRKEEYGYRIYDNVFTSADLEKMYVAHEVLTHQGEIPQRVAFIHCVGSRDEKVNNRHCSKACCATAVKQACEMKELYPDTEVYCFYMDLRMFDLHFEQMYHDAQTRYGVQFVRGRLSEASEDKDGRIVMKAEDTLAGKPLRMTVDMLVLMTGMETSDSNQTLSHLLNIEVNDTLFFKPKNNYTSANYSSHEGIFLAGTCTGPKTIPETLADARAAAVEVHSFLSVNKGTS